MATSTWAASVLHSQKVPWRKERKGGQRRKVFLCVSVVLPWRPFLCFSSRLFLFPFIYPHRPVTNLFIRDLTITLMLHCFFSLSSISIGGWLSSRPSIIPFNNYHRLLLSHGCPPHQYSFSLKGILAWAKNTLAFLQRLYPSSLFFILILVALLVVVSSLKTNQLVTAASSWTTEAIVSSCSSGRGQGVRVWEEWGEQNLWRTWSSDHFRTYAQWLVSAQSSVTDGLSVLEIYKNYEAALPVLQPERSF